MQNVNIYHYLDPVNYLQDCLLAKQSRNAKYSLRSWSRDLGIAEATVLSQILSTKRPIPLTYAVAFSKNLKLNVDEADYLEAIIGAKNAKLPSEKGLWIKKVQKLSMRAEFKVEEYNELRVLEDPLNVTLMGLVELAQFKPELDWIQTALAKKYSEAEIQKSLDFLLKHQFIQVTQDGIYSRTQKHLSTKPDVASLWIKKFHELSLKDAAEAIYEQSLEEREYGGYVFSLRKSDLPQMKTRIRTFTEELLAEFTHADQVCDAVYQFNVNLFSRTSVGEEA